MWKQRGYVCVGARYLYPRTCSLGFVIAYAPCVICAMCDMRAYVTGKNFCGFHRGWWGWWLRRLW